MRIEEFDYDLPEALIAQEPALRRDISRLMVVRRDTGTITHHVFTDIPDLLSPNDLLILNDTRVVAARLVGQRARTGGKWEGLFVRAHPDGVWEILLQTRGKLVPGETLLAGSLSLHLIEKVPPGRWLVRPSEAGSFTDVLARHGQVPIPPYIREGRAAERDAERYQTLYAREPGAVAAPTAGLHFTDEVFAALKAKGIGRAFVTLHVGPGTFQPVKVDDLAQHQVEAEWGELPVATAQAIRSCQGRVIAVGTTSVRVLETAGRTLEGWSGQTNLTICPPFAFQVVEALLTNFHLPRSSLLVLVSAFARHDLIRHAYDEAVRQQYRFYSYGDAMLIL